jgi:hypothetical protein
MKFFNCGLGWYTYRLAVKPLRRPRLNWEDNIEMIGWGGMDWIDLAQDRDQWRTLVKTVINLRVP